MELRGVGEMEKGTNSTGQGYYRARIFFWADHTRVRAGYSHLKFITAT